MTTPTTATELGRTSSLSPWAGPYVTDMLGKAAALGKKPYEAYKGPLTAGASNLQNQAFSGLANLAVPQAFTTGSFTGSAYTPPTAASALSGGTGAAGYYTPASGNVVQNYMNPYLEAALQPQYEQAAQDYGLAQRDLQSRYGKAGAYGGSRQGAAEGVLGGEALRNMSAITGRGYEQAYANAQSQFDKDRAYGLEGLLKQADLGAVQRGIDVEGINADIGQFEAERNDPYKQLQFQNSLLQGLPITTQSYQYAEPSSFAQATSGASGVIGLLQSIGLLPSGGAS